MPALRPLLAPNTFLPRRSLVLIHQAINHLLCRGGTARPAGARNPKHRVCSGWVQSSYLLDSTRPSAPKKPIGDGGLQLRAAAGRKGQATGHRAFRCSDTAGMRLVGISISYITALGLWSGSGPGWLGLNVTSSQWLFGGALCRSPRAGIHTTKSTTQRALIQRQQTRPRAQTSSEGSPAGPGRGTVAARGSRPLGTAWQGLRLGRAGASGPWGSHSSHTKFTPAKGVRATLPTAFAAGTEPGSDAAGEMELPESPSWSLPGHGAPALKWTRPGIWDCPLPPNHVETFLVASLNSPTKSHRCLEAGALMEVEHCSAQPTWRDFGVVS